MNLTAPGVRAQSVKIDSTIYSSRVVHIQGKRYTILLTTRGCFIQKGRDTLVRHQGDYFVTMTVKDFNNDGYADILLNRNEIRSNVFDLLLYDPVLRTFKEVRDFDRVPGPTPIPKTKLYFSYYAIGCADADWICELFYIDHFRTVIIGRMEGNGCETNRSRSIRIFKATGTEITTFPMTTVKRYGNKWSFIKQYWLHMHKRFL